MTTKVVIRKLGRGWISRCPGCDMPEWDDWASNRLWATALALANMHMREDHR